MGLIPEPQENVYIPRFEDMTMLIYGEQGSGKTSFFSGEPDPLICAVEPGSDFVKGRVVNVRNWETFCELVNEVYQIKQREPHKISSVVIDIVDGLYGLCEEHICKIHGVNTVKDVGGYGAGHAEVKKLFTSWVTSLYHLVPIRFLTHQTDEEYEVVNDAGLIEKKMKKTAQFGGKKGELVRGWCQLVGHMFVNANDNHTITFKKYGSKLTKDRTGIFDHIGDIELPNDSGLAVKDKLLGYPHVEKLFEDKAQELGFELINHRRKRNA
jgi:hypothetical protein